MTRVLVAGATGQLGRRVLAELRVRGYATRALVRDERRASRLRGEADEAVVGDVTRPETLARVCEGVNVVFSAVGAPLTLKRGGASFREVDFEGNKNLLNAAVSAGVGKFVYVSVFGAEQLGETEYVRAHEDFVSALKRSPLKHVVVRPTGFFSAMGEILRMARRGPVMSVGDGAARTNPIHEADLATVCAEAVAGERESIEVGGPEVFTRQQIAEMAFASLGKRPKTFKVPAPLVRLMIAPLRLFDARLYALMSFFVAVAQVDAVAPRSGSRRLADYFNELARGDA
ncbi:MAG TPA: SDR family oxidoreductase [Pyrinomonadaceae bacterium]|nr:SDR family oxidoreductase [Pyrinomonadaceae bacterium]